MNQKLLAIFLFGSISYGVAQSQEPAAWSERVPKVADARHHYVSQQGKPDNSGTRDAPWDLASALAGKQKVAPGDVIWIRGGRYHGDNNKLQLGLTGTENAPIHVRGVPGERVTILDTETSSLESIAHVWVWDLEMTSSEAPKPADAKPVKGSGSVGLFLRWGKGCKFLNLVIHGIPGGGMSWWTEAGEGEVHGCLIYGNGWNPDAPKHGHCIYTQNRDGVKTISNCIMSVPSGDPCSVYASGTVRAFVDNFLFEDNIIHDRGLFLVGGGSPSRGNRVLRNYLYDVDMRLGNGPQNEDCEVRDNLLAGGILTIDKFKKAVAEGNTHGVPKQQSTLIPNKYDPNRAHVVLFNGAKAAGVPVAVGSYLKPGESYRLLDPKDPFGAPVHAGTCAGPTIAIPMKNEFAAYVVVKGQGK